MPEGNPPNMSELPSWLQVIIGVLGLILPFLVQSRCSRRHRRRQRDVHLKVWSIEYRRRDVTDDHQL